MVRRLQGWARGDAVCKAVTQNCYTACMFRLLMFFLGAIGVMAVVALSVAPKPSPAVEKLESVKVASTPKRPQHQSGGDEMEIQRDESGQFHLTAQVNGEDTVFLVDTGADAVTLTIAEAERLGIEIDSNSFRPIVRTASGTGYGTRIHIDQIEVAGQQFEDVDALVVKGLDVNLLGQTVLRRMGNVELRGDSMIIRRAN
jgi:aspartyl protease family protein